jgi:hypothetical protein
LTYDKWATYRKYFRRRFGHLLTTQRRYLDVENWFKGYSADRKLLNATVQDEVLALGILAEARMFHGSYPEAGKALSQAMVCLEKNGLHHSRLGFYMIELSACLKWIVNDLVSCEHLLQENLRIAEAMGDEPELVYAVSRMWEFYRGCQRWDMAARLSESYPEILGE